ncbi:MULTISPECIES: phosphatase PAP2 family protein [unclassified Gemella]|uniref:phosphatase PAP2 family protein n=1 Tax=unclassified Gemella TaxID=2624949 RepID=UPI001073611C|nr:MULTISPECIES: phosphatase PAP2 family protein [unclassified Gemella]MBF0709646.1 phosphatase PAP2 family protein [Gemella sp. GL1.1]MBF0746935.1 phosphatase PAP2 family protein [Gemella sp. 19428wG2_WT2a]NYS26990.1 phosphatase PAP2 family protein [Gemella sp. GL1]TFU59161.1 phosphatase PAP2 family protein [Gemella sp. WT2a]
MKNRILFGITLLSILPFLYLIYVKAYRFNLSIDVNVWYFVERIRSNELTKFFSTITHLGDAWLFVILMTALVIWIIKRKSNLKLAAWLGFSAILGAWLMNKFIKEYFMRPRPFVSGYIENLTSASGYSFPSGHSMGSIICYILIAYIFSLYSRSKFINILVYVGLIILSAIIAISRVYLGVHYPTDIIAGFTFGIFIVNIFIIIRRFLVKV